MNTSRGPLRRTNPRHQLGSGRASENDCRCGSQGISAKDPTGGFEQATIAGEIGGHPTPEARLLLPDHGDRLPSTWWWLELAINGLSTWKYVVEGAGRAGYLDQAKAIGDRHRVSELADAWRNLDGFAALASRLVSEDSAADLD